MTPRPGRAGSLGSPAGPWAGLPADLFAGSPGAPGPLAYRLPMGSMSTLTGVPQMRSTS